MKPLRKIGVLATALVLGLGLAGAAAAQVTGTTVKTTLIGRGHGSAGSTTASGVTFFERPLDLPLGVRRGQPNFVPTTCTAPCSPYVYEASNGQELQFQVTATQIIITALPTTGFDWGIPTNISGVEFSFSGDPRIDGVTVDGSTTAPTTALDIKHVSFNDVSFLFDGENWSSNEVGIFDLSFAPTPEPATWAMMFIGFAGVGVILRRRNRSVGVSA